MTNPETTPTRHEAPDVAELRRLLAANELPWALWNGYGPDVRGDMRVARIGHLSGPGIQTDSDSADMYGTREAFELLVSAVNALPGLLADAAERDALADDADKWQRAALTLQGDRDNARAEVERLRAQVEAVRALHFEDPFQNGSCNECDSWLPCPTISALDGGADS